MTEALKQVRWIGSSRRDLRAMPPQVRRDIGQALYTQHLKEAEYDYRERLN